MTSQEFFQKVLAHWKGVMLTMIAFAVVGFNIALLLPARFESTMSMIVIQKHASDKVDAFSAARSAEYLGGILTRAVYTNSFLEDVMKAPGITDTLNKVDPEERMKDWKKTTSAKKINNTGILEISVLSTSRDQAQKIAQAIAWNFQNKGQSYHGGGESVEIRLMDGPVTSIRPTVPSIPLYTLFSAVVGLVVGAGFSAVRKKASVADRYSAVTRAPQEEYENKKELLQKYLRESEGVFGGTGISANDGVRYSS